MDKQCCSAFYERPEVVELMGESFHPGGPELTARLIDSLVLQPGQTVLDVACGLGVSTVALAKQAGVAATGIDLSETNVQRATARADVSGLSIDFVTGDAVKLPFADDSFDAVVCECALSTFEDKSAVLAEFARVTRRGGRLGLSDMAVYGALPPRVAELAGPWACLGDAEPVERTQRRLLDAGYRIGICDDESATLHTLALELKRKLVVVGLGKLGGLLDTDVSITELRAAIADARQAVRDGVVQYYRLAAALGGALPAASPSANSTAVPVLNACEPTKTGCC